MSRQSALSEPTSRHEEGRRDHSPEATQLRSRRGEVIKDHWENHSAELRPCWQPMEAGGLVWGGLC